MSWSKQDRAKLVLLDAMTATMARALIPYTGGRSATVLIVIGGSGPMLAAAIVIRSTGGSISEWLRGLLHWRVPARYYVYALGLPVLIMAVMNLVVAALGERPDLSQLPKRIPPYLLGFVLTALIFGGQEEPGWRGFALPRLEERRSPMVATLILGFGWGIWRIPLYGPAGFVVPLVLAFLYTWLQQDPEHPPLRAVAREPHARSRSSLADSGLGHR